MSEVSNTPHVVVVGGGFAGVGCAKRLAKEHVRVTLLDRHNYHQFLPLLYQVASSQLAPSDVAYSLRDLFHRQDEVTVQTADVVGVDPGQRTVTLDDGSTISGDYLVLAAGSQPNFFHTPGADEHAFPLYSLEQSERLRSRILGLFEDADRHPGHVDQGALNFVVVGGGPTGVEMAGALADMIRDVVSVEYADLSTQAARVYLVDAGHTVLRPFSDEAHDYAAKVLEHRGVQLVLGTRVREVAADHVSLDNGSTIPTRAVIWAGGLMAAPVAARAGMPRGHGGRIDVEPDFTIDGFPGVYACGDVANIPGRDDTTLPQLGSVALQSGRWVARNIAAHIAGKSRKPFHYHDKGIMAMVGRNAAIAEVGAHRHELHGPLAFASWLGLHAYLMSGVRNRVEAFVDWAWDYFEKGRGPQVLDRPDVARIDWDDQDSEG